MVDEGGSVPPIINSIDKLDDNSSLNISNVKNSGGIDEVKNVPILSTDTSSQNSSSSPFGKGLGKKPYNFEKMAEIYDKDHNVINLVPGAGLCFSFVCFLFYFRSR
jgi:hypothetical protein